MKIWHRTKSCAASGPGRVPKSDSIPYARRKCDFVNGAGQETCPHIFIDSGEPKDHGNFVVKSCKSESTAKTL